MVAVRDHGVRLREPRLPVIERIEELESRVADVTLGRPNPSIGMRHRQLLLEAGCVRAEGYADAAVFGDPAALSRNAALLRGLLAAPERRQAAAECGFTEDALDQISHDLDAWYERPDAILVVVWSAGIGWVD